jgi:AraC-like DNA-binding protein/quercetin dioxygenase-like cupin family protein
MKYKSITMSKSSILRFDTFNVEKSTYEPGLYLAPHKDVNSRISIILKGNLEEKTDIAHIKATAGSMVLKPNHVTHENTFGSGGSTLLSVSFHKDFVLPPVMQSWQWLEHPQMTVWGMQLWLQMQRVKNDKELTIVFTGFIDTINSVISNQKPVKPNWLNDIEQSIGNNLDEAETVQMLSEKHFIHRVYLSRAFKKQFGSSPLEFRKYARVTSAIRGLTMTEKSLAGIAYESGFSDQSHMTRTLQKILGYAPGELRKLVKNF